MWELNYMRPFKLLIWISAIKAVRGLPTGIESIETSVHEPIVLAIVSLRSENGVIATMAKGKVTNLMRRAIVVCRWPRRHVLRQMDAAFVSCGMVRRCIENGGTAFAVPGCG